MRIIHTFWISFILIVLNQLTSYANEVKSDASALHILYYENIEFEEDPYQFINGLPLEDFEKHLKFLHDEAYNIIDLENPDEYSKIKGSKNVAIVLNGNDKEAIEFATPLLEKYEYPLQFSIDVSNMAYRKINKRVFTHPYLNIRTLNEQSDFTQKIANDATSRFRDVFNITPNSLFLDDATLYLKHKEIFNRYNFKKIFLPTNEANLKGANDPTYSYISVQPSFSNLDILRTYLNRRPFPHQHINATKHKDKDHKITKISWGLTLLEGADFDSKQMSCISSEGQKAEIFNINNRIEIRHSKNIDDSAIRMHCTAPILDKNSNKTDTYRYIMLHEPFSD